MGSGHLYCPFPRGTLKWTESLLQAERLLRPPGANVSGARTVTIMGREHPGVKSPKLTDATDQATRGMAMAQLSQWYPASK